MSNVITENMSYIDYQKSGLNDSTTSLVYTDSESIPPTKPNKDDSKMFKLLKSASIKKNSTGIYHEGDTVYASTPACIGSIGAVLILLIYLVTRAQ